MTSSTLSSLSSAGAWVLPESTGLSDRWEMTFFYGRLYLAVTCLVLACQRSTIRGFFGRRLLDLFPVFSSLLGSTVDTDVCQCMEALVLGSCDRFSSCSLFSVFSALLGSTVDTSFASISREFHYLLRELVDYGS